MEAGQTRVLIVVPVYNNENTVAKVVREISDMGLPLLVVDDGSIDGSVSALADIPIHLIHFPRNRGKGRAIRSALSWAEDHGYSHIITVDADGQHAAKDIPRFLEKIQESPEKIIIGKRRFGLEVPRASRFGRRWSNMWIRIASGRPTPDSQSGFRAYPVDRLAPLKFLGSRYEFEVEVLVRAAWAGVELDWVDVSVRYFSSEQRISHFRPFRDNLRISFIYFLLVSRHLLPLPHRRLYQESDNPRASTPLESALAGWLGVFFRALPLPGFQRKAIILYAKKFGLDQHTALSVSRICLPYCPPFIPFLAIEGGHLILRGRFLQPADFNGLDKIVRILLEEAHLRLFEYLLGGLCLGLLFGFIVFLIIRWSLSCPDDSRNS